MSTPNNLSFRIQGTDAQFRQFEHQCQVTELMLASTLIDRFQIPRTQENLELISGWMASARSMGIGNHLTSGIKMELVDPHARPMPPGAEMILRERLRQIDELGHSSTSDDAWTKGELSAAASTYLQCACAQTMFGDKPGISEREAIRQHIAQVVEDTWPWGREWFKLDDDPQKNRIKAAALIAADLDRAQRASDRVHEDLDSSCGE